MSDGSQDKLYTRDEMMQARRRIADLEAALKVISEYRSRCVYSHNVAFRDGSHAAFLEVAEIAEVAIDAAQGGEKPNDKLHRTAIPDIL